MKKIAMFSPLSPQKSGISYFTEDILPYLSKEFDIDLFVDGFKPSKKTIIHTYNVYDISEFENRKDDYVINVYQIGNNPYHSGILDMAKKYPGIVFLHDYAIHNLHAHNYLIRDKNHHGYFQMIGMLYGETVKNEAYTRYYGGHKNLWETNPLDYPTNEYLTKKSLGMIVFSKFLKQKMDAYHFNVPVFGAHLYSGEEKLNLKKDDKTNAKVELGYKKSDILVCSFGFVNKNKRPLQLLDAFSKIHNDTVKLVFIGQVQDSISAEFKTKIKQLGLGSRVIQTGFIQDEVFKKYLLACDINVSLRYPTMGETSGVVMRGFAYAAPAIVTDIGSFSEIDESIAIKVPYDAGEIEGIYNGLNVLIKNKSLRNDMSKKAMQYAEEHLTLSKTTGDIMAFINAIIDMQKMRAGTEYSKTLDNIVDTMMEMNIDNAEMRSKVIDRYADVLQELF